MIRQNPMVPLAMGFVLLLLGLYIGSELLGSEPDAPAPLGRSARYESLRSKRPAPRPARAAAALVATTFGLGLGAYALRQLRRQGQLLTEGIPVVGVIARVVSERRASHLVYRFRDDAGVEREGTYDTLGAGDFLEHFEVGQEVTVVYDAADSSRHVLDVDHVRRADARVRLL